MLTPPLPFTRRRKAIIAVAAAVAMVTVLAAAAILTAADRRPGIGAAAKPAAAATPEKARWSGVSSVCPVLSDATAKSLGVKTAPLPSSQTQQPPNPVMPGYTAAGIRNCQWLPAKPGGWLVATVFVFDHDPARGKADDVARDFITVEKSLHPVDCTVPTLTLCWRGAVSQTEFAATSHNAVIGLHCSDKPRPTDSSLAAVSSELLSKLAL